MYSLTVVVKASFVLVHGAEAAVAPSQDEPGVDSFIREEPGASLRHSTDLAPLKPRTDVLVVGHVHSPGGAPVTELECRIEVGEIEKTLRVTGDRRYVPGPAGPVIGPPAAFTKMPMSYERAPKGEENPVGWDAEAFPALGAMARPNFEVIRGERAGLGPISPAWPSRRRLLSEQAFSWATDERNPARGPAPEGLDFGFFNAAPADQQIPMLRPGATIVLEHLHPTLARVESRLPAARPQAFRIDPRTGRVSEVMLRCDTLTIDADRGRVILVFRGLTDIPSPDPVAIGTIVVASHPQGKRVRPVDIEKVVRQGGSLEDVAGAPELHPLEVRHDTRPLGRARANETISASPAAAPGNPLPFRTNAPQPSPKPVETAPGPPAWTLRTAPVPADLDITPLPFRPPAVPSAPPAAAPRPTGGLPFGSSTVHIGAAPLGVRPATPFERPAEPPRPAPPPPVDLDDEEPPTPPRPSAPPPISGKPLGAITLAPHAAAALPAIPFAPKDAVRPELVRLPPEPAPPPLVAAESSKTNRSDLELSLPLPLQKIAALAAEVASPTADVAMVLRRHGLTEAAWANIEAVTTAALAEDAARREGELLRAYDDLYVARMADLGRRLDMQGHARLYLASARRQLSRCIEELGLGRADLMPLRRTLARSIQKDPASRAELERAIEAERAASPLPAVGFFARPGRRE